jgi:hypothetical protein
MMGERNRAQRLVAVVPAQAGTQYSEEFVAMTSHACSVRVYWVPACAGTTEEMAQ